MSLTKLSTTFWWQETFKQLQDKMRKMARVTLSIFLPLTWASKMVISVEFLSMEVHEGFESNSSPTSHRKSDNWFPRLMILYHFADSSLARKKFLEDNCSQSTLRVPDTLRTHLIIQTLRITSPLPSISEQVSFEYLHLLCCRELHTCCRMTKSLNVNNLDPPPSCAWRS